MELSETERRLLQEMESHLLAEDPSLASSLGAHRLRPGVRVLLVAAGLVGGIALMAVGLSLAHLPGILTALVGFVVVLAAVVVADSLRLGRTRSATTGPGANPTHPG